MGMFRTNQQQDSNQMSAGEKHDATMQQLDEIKRYAAGIFSKVDSEIDDIRVMVDRLDKQLRESAQQLQKMEQLDRTIRNVESAIKNLERKIK
jgi:predicted RNase H-like nuclease (RuvC/YqgF family)